MEKCNFFNKCYWNIWIPKIKNKLKNEETLPLIQTTLKLVEIDSRSQYNSKIIKILVESIKENLWQFFRQDTGTKNIKDKFW